MSSEVENAGSETRQAVLRAARRWIGTPYRHQGSTRGVGCDCLGLVRGLWREIHSEEPEAPGVYAADWAEAGGGDRMLMAARRHFNEKPTDAALPGDLILFRWRPHLPAKHAGIMDEGGRFIHAYQGSAVVSSALVPQWRRRIAGAFAFPDLPRSRGGF